MKLSAYLLCLSLALGGCASLASNDATRDFAAIGAWTRHQGGVVIDQRLDRVQTIGTSLAVAAPCPVRYHILNNSGLTAYSWPEGEIFLSAGLVDAASDDEIAAAVAHEMGHLVNDAHGHGAVGLRGIATSQALEQRADSTGAEMLAASGRPTGALITLLQKVCAANASAECRREITARIHLLETTASR